jgi:hypothetical protein
LQGFTVLKTHTVANLQFQGMIVQPAQVSWVLN